MSTTIEQDIIKQEASNFDVKFIFENGQQIGGRVAMLAAKSPVFEAMFKGSMTRQVNIKDINPDTFEHLLFFMHSGKMKIQGSQQLLPWLPKAELSKIPEIPSDQFCYISQKSQYFSLRIYHISP